MKLYEVYYGVNHLQKSNPKYCLNKKTFKTKIAASYFCIKLYKAARLINITGLLVRKIVEKEIE